MKSYASSDSGNSLIAEIVDKIKTVYPVGFKINTPEYDEHPKVKKIETEIGKHMDDYNNYIKPWTLFLKSIPKGFKSKIHNSGFARDLAYSGRLTLEKYQDDSLIRIKAIIFNVSWLADYFTVYGIDETFIKEKNDPHNIAYPALNVITVSPHKEFEYGFNYLMHSLAVGFPEHKFVPFRICQLLIENVQSIQQMGDNCTIYNSLFNNSLDLISTNFLRGDSSYGMPSSKVSVILRPPPTF